MINKYQIYLVATLLFLVGCSSVALKKTNTLEDTKKNHSSFEDTKKLAEQGDKQAQYDRGMAHFQGIGTLQDYTDWLCVLIL